MGKSIKYEICIAEYQRESYNISGMYILYQKIFVDLFVFCRYKRRFYLLKVRAVAKANYRQFEYCLSWNWLKWRISAAVYLEMLSARGREAFQKRWEVDFSSKKVQHCYELGLQSMNKNCTSQKELWLLWKERLSTWFSEISKECFK